MPNWCGNILVAVGENNDIAELVSHAQSDDIALDFENIVPIGNVEDAHDRRVRSWGTKWNATDCQEQLIVVSSTHSAWIVTYSTAWSAPSSVITALSSQHPKLWMANASSESGNAYYSVLTCKEKNFHETDLDTDFALSVVTGSGAIIARSGGQGSVLIPASERDAREAILATYSHVDPYEVAVLVLDSRENVDYSEVFAPFSVEDFVGALSSENSDDYAAECFYGRDEHSPLFTEFLATFDPASKDPIRWALYSSLSSINEYGWGSDRWERTWQDRNEIAFSSWVNAWRDAFSKGINGLDAYTLINRFTVNELGPQPLTELIVDTLSS
jgi:hypothetical protein